MESVLCAQSNKTIYTNGNLIDAPQPFEGNNFFKDKESIFVDVTLQTPLRVKKKEHLVTTLTEESFQELFELSSISSFEKIKEDWVDFKRHSYRQNESMRFGGIIGRYRMIIPNKDGNFAQLNNLILCGLGKNKTFGFGVIDIREV